MPAPKPIASAMGRVMSRSDGRIRRGGSSACGSFHAVRGDQDPVRVAARSVAGEGPDVGEGIDVTAVTFDDRAVAALDDIDLLALEAHRDDRAAALHLDAFDARRLE